MKLFTICVAFFLLSLLQWRGVRDDPFVNNDVIGVYAVTPLHARQVQTQLALSLKRGLLLASLAGISRTATFPLPVYASDRSSLGTPREIANFIRSNCAFTLQAVKQAGSVLYRGEGNTSAATAFIATPPPDLLLPDTYAEYGPIAADYFRTLDQALPALHVAGAHLASTDATEASQWGVVHSCWPLDHGLHYAWLRGEYKWWSNDYAIPQGKYGPFFWKNASKMRKFLNEKVILDANLNNLLARGGEVN